MKWSHLDESCVRALHAVSHACVSFYSKCDGKACLEDDETMAAGATAVTGDVRYDIVGWGVRRDDRWFFKLHDDNLSDVVKVARGRDGRCW